MAPCGTSKSQIEMAFNAIMQLSVATITGQLKENPSVVEFGNQRFRYDQDWVEHCSKIAHKNIKTPVEFVWEFFDGLGYSDYLAIDINTELRSIAMDLNFILKDKYQYEAQFDLVTNNGTGEHIFDQRVVFENMHNLCCVNGVMLCVLPFSPWINHGFYNFNPNLFRDICAANNYELKFLWLAQNTGAYIELRHAMDSWSFFEQKRPLSPPSRLEEAFWKLSRLNNNPSNISIVAAYKKVSDKTFQIPMQGRYVNDLVDELKANYSESNKDVRQKDHTSANY
jgi:hypothetical protein